MIIGIDEVGRGCWAGPLLVVTARFAQDLPPLKDSKKLTKKQRETLFTQIANSCEIGEGWVEAEEIDIFGLNEAMKLGVGRALKALNAKFNEKIIMDGNINYCDQQYSNVESVVKADSLYPIVSAASIYAKVRRDNKMSELAQVYPGYGFEVHVGYGTSLHKEALNKLGVSKIHRKSFKPMYTLLNS